MPRQITPYKAIAPKVEDNGIGRSLRRHAIFHAIRKFKPISDYEIADWMQQQKKAFDRDGKKEQVAECECATVVAWKEGLKGREALLTPLVVVLKNAFYPYLELGNAKGAIKAGMLLAETNTRPSEDLETYPQAIAMLKETVRLLGSCGAPGRERQMEACSNKIAGLSLEHDQQVGNEAYGLVREERADLKDAEDIITNGFLNQKMKDGAISRVRELWEAMHFRD